MRSWALVPVACPGDMGVGIDGDRQWRKPHEGGYSIGTPMVFARQLCLFTSDLRPQFPAVRIRPQPQFGGDAADRMSQEIAITGANGATITLRAGWSKPLTWLPQPVMGCALDSGAPAWGCFASFLRESLYSPDSDRTPQGADDVVARALGLQQITIRERYPNADWR